ncbi:MAG TPA: redoxin domain-containing protein [Bacteroidales bacterium]|nr:redoxin domain-containing protein [Bacteroidales bacterium]
MKNQNMPEENYSSRMKELQEKFRALEHEIEDSDTKNALSAINGMIQEVWRKVANLSESSESTSRRSFKDIASLYKNAPKMDMPAVSNPLPDGAKAPDFSLSDAYGNQIKLSELKGTKVLLVFYPLDWSPGCSQQLDLYQQEYAEFEKRGIKLLAISVDSIYSHGAWLVVRDLHFTLLSDFNPKGEVAKLYQIYREKDGFSERALYIIDKDGFIRYSYVSPYLNHVPDISVLFEKIDNIRESVNV